MMIRRLRCAVYTTGRSRTAATMLSRLICQDAPTTATKVMHHAQAVGDDQAARLDVRLDREEVAEHGVHASRETERRQHAERRADANRRGARRIRPSLDELLDELASLRADRARHPHLGPPLGGQHREDEDDQEDAGGDREEADQTGRRR